MALLEVVHLSVEYQTLHGTVHAVRDVSLALERGRALGLVGESGCGKTTMARALIGVLPRNGRITSGAVRFDGTDLLALPPDAQIAYRWRRIAIVPQAAMDSLDPGGLGPGAAAVCGRGIGGAPAASLSPRTQRRHEAARGHRHGAGAGAGAGHRR
jgi:ABC-type oligopeptide transport system ATPase subunit